MTFSWLSKPTKGHEQVSNIAVRASPWCEWTWWKPGPVRLSVGFLLPSSPDQSAPGAGRRTQRFLLEELQWWPVCRWRVTAGGMWETTADRMLEASLLLMCECAWGGRGSEVTDSSDRDRLVSGVAALNWWTAAGLRGATAGPRFTVLAPLYDFIKWRKSTSYLNHQTFLTCQILSK